MIRRISELIDAFAPADGAPPRQTLPFMRWSLRGAEKGIALAVLMAFLAGATELIAARYTGWVIDSAAELGPGAFWEKYWHLVAFGVGFYFVVRPLIFIADAAVSSVLIGPQLFPLILSRVNRYTLGHAMGFFENDFAGRLAQKATQIARSLTDLVLEITDFGIFAIAMLLGAFWLLGGVDPRLLLVFVAWGALYVAVLRYFIPRVQVRSAARAGARTAVTGQIVDTMTNIATVKLFARDQDEDRNTLDALEDFRQRSLDFGEMLAVFRVAMVTLGGMLPMVTILGSLYLWTKGHATSGDIAMIAMITTRLAMLTNRLGRAAISVFTHVGEIQDGMRTLAPPHAITDRDGALDQAPIGDLRFEHLTFTYGGEKHALNDFDLTVRQGEKIALVGASGAGKSTVISLLLRLHEVEQGRILLDGVDIRDLTQQALRRAVSVVRQEASMFNRSALENIRYGRPEATDDEVFEAARRASAHEFIQELRDHKGRIGYDARLGERGVKLSGGQRQRIALARAILKDAPILVLDEATSALDSEVEAEIQDALETVMVGKTVLAIAHRLSTIAAMDRIVVLHHGQIVEQGAHEALLAKQGLYARYWERQSGGFLGEAAE